MDRLVLVVMVLALVLPVMRAQDCNFANDCGNQQGACDDLCDGNTQVTKKKKEKKKKS